MAEPTGPALPASDGAPALDRRGNAAAAAAAAAANGFASVALPSGHRSRLLSKESYQFEVLNEVYL